MPAGSLPAGLLEITLEDDDAVHVTTDSGLVKIAGTTTSDSANAVEAIAVHGGPGDNEIDLSVARAGAFTSLTKTVSKNGDWSRATPPPAVTVRLRADPPSALGKAPEWECGGCSPLGNDGTGLPRV